MATGTHLAEAEKIAAPATARRRRQPRIGLDLALPLDESLAHELTRAASGPYELRLPKGALAGSRAGAPVWIPDRVRGIWVPHLQEDGAIAAGHGADAPCAPSAEWVEMLGRCARKLDNCGYAAIPALFPPYLLRVAADYYIRLAEAGAMRLDTAYSQRFVAHRDPIAEWLHKMASATLAPLYAGRYRPSYSFVCAYVGGAELPRHTDRPQCEITVSLCIAATPGAERWPLFLECAAEEAIVEARLGIGSALVFKGRELPHYRTALQSGEYFLSILFHFVPVDFKGSLD